MLSLVSLSIIPETPIWLTIKNKPEEARKSLAWLRGWTKTENVEEEFNELWSQTRAESEQKESKTLYESVVLFKKKEIYKPMALIVYSYVLVQFSGSGCITTYAVKIFASLKAPINEFYVTAILGVMQFTACCVCISVINVLGKRVITFLSLAGIAVFLLGTAIYLFIWDILYIDNVQIEDPTKHWFPVVLVLLSSFSAHMGVVLLPWNIMGEVFPDEGRSTAAGIACAVGYIISSIANFIFPTLVSMITLPGVLMLFSLVAGSGLPSLHFFLPETEGKTLHEISAHFKGLAKMDNKVKRFRKEPERNEGNINS